MLHSHHTEQRNERVADEERVEQLAGDLAQLLNFGLVAPARLPRHLPPSTRRRLHAASEIHLRRVVRLPWFLTRKTLRLRDRCVMTSLVRTVPRASAGHMNASVSRHHININSCCSFQHRRKHPHEQRPCLLHKCPRTHKHKYTHTHTAHWYEMDPFEIPWSLLDDRSQQEGFFLFLIKMI